MDCRSTLCECAFTTAATAARVWLIVVLLPNWFGSAYADSPPAPDPTERWALEFYSGAIFSVGSRSSPLDYTILPQIPTLKSGAIMRRKLGGGDLVVRNRFSLLIEPIVQGPETHYIGLAAAPSIEWWNAARTYSTFFSIGGGFGWMDSRGPAVPGGQGQDFNFNWFMHGGVSMQLNERVSAPRSACTSSTSPTAA